ncbi:hypothetical protein Tco_0586834 [Tanacetum coccineum]
MPHDSPLLRGDTLGSNEGIMQQNELMDLVIKLLDKCAALERDLRQTKKVYGDAFTRLIKKVKKLEKTIKTSQTRRSTAGASMLVSTASTVQEVNKDKGKGIMTESEPEQTKTKLQQRQERAGYEAAVRLQEQLDEEERQRIARVHEKASSFNIEEWEDIQATIEADEELA